MRHSDQAAPLEAIISQLPESHRISLDCSTRLYPALHAAGDAGLPMLVIDNALGHATIALQGAHLMAFHPTGQNEKLWVSPKCVLEAGKPIRGGIPLCMPWFGPGPDGKSMHGFARTLPWTLVSADALPAGATKLVLELAGDAATCELWPHAFVFRLEIVVGKELQLCIVARNLSDKPAPFAFAFHTYFAVNDVTNARIGGLEGLSFLDKMDSFARKTQTGDVAIAEATDRIYLDVPATQTLASDDNRARIDSDARCAVVWNAGANDMNIPDLGAGNHIGYLCVERGDLADYALTLPAGGVYRMQMALSF